MSETTISGNIRRYLKSIGAKAIKTHGSIFSRKGTPDIIGCYQGRFIVFETKKPGERLTPLQAYELAQWLAAGAIGGRVESVAQVKELLSISLDIHPQPRPRKGPGTSKEARP